MKLFYNTWTIYENHNSKDITHYFDNKEACDKQFETLHPCVHICAMQGEAELTLEHIARIMFNSKNNHFNIKFNEQDQATINEHIKTLKENYLPF